MTSVATRRSTSPATTRRSVPGACRTLRDDFCVRLAARSAASHVPALRFARPSMDPVVLLVTTLQAAAALAVMFVIPGLALGPLLAPGASTPLARAGRAVGVSLLTVSIACTVLARLGILWPATTLLAVGGHGPRRVRDGPSNRRAPCGRDGGGDDGWVVRRPAASSPPSSSCFRPARPWAPSFSRSRRRSGTTPTSPGTWRSVGGSRPPSPSGARCARSRRTTCPSRPIPPRPCSCCPVTSRSSSRCTAWPCSSSAWCWPASSSAGGSAAGSRCWAPSFCWGRSGSASSTWPTSPRRSGWTWRCSGSGSSTAPWSSGPAGSRCSPSVTGAVLFLSHAEVFLVYLAFGAGLVAARCVVTGGGRVGLGWRAGSAGTAGLGLAILLAAGAGGLLANGALTGEFRILGYVTGDAATRGRCHAGGSRPRGGATGMGLQW